MQDQSEEYEELQIGGAIIQASSTESALVVYVNAEMRNREIVLEGIKPFKRKVTERYIDNEKLYMAVFSSMRPGKYTMSWGNKTTQITLETGKITQIGLGVRASRPTKTTTRQVSKKAEPLTTILGEDTRTREQIIVDDVSRCSGCYVIGTQGVGKSSLLEHMIYQDIAKGYAVIVLDPHGQLIENIITRMSQDHLKRSYFLDLADEAYPFGFNIFSCRDLSDSRERTITRNRVASIFDKVWPSETRGLLLPMLLQNVTETLIEHADSMTMADIPALLLDADYRAKKVKALRSKRLKEYWQLEYDTNSASVQRRETAPLRTRLNSWLSDPVITNIICQKEATIDFRRAIDNHEVILIKLPISTPGYEHAAPIIGTMILSQIYAATFSFADTPEAKRLGYSLYIDEFQKFASSDTARLFTEGRKYKVRQTLAHQTRTQLTLKEVASATLTANTIISFRTEPDDSYDLARVFSDIDLFPEIHIHRDVLPKMKAHKSHAVSDFWAKYVRKWEAADEKSIREKKEVEDHRWYKETHTLEILPQRDLGHGIVKYRPEWVREALEALENLIVDTQRRKQVNNKLKMALIREAAPLLKFVDYYNAAYVPDEEEEKGNLPLKVYLQADHHDDFIAALDSMLDALIKSPIGEKEETDKAAIEAYLIHLPNRAALARLQGTTTHQLTTIALSFVSLEQASQRIQRIQEQTREKYCRPREEVEAELTGIETFADDEETDRQDEQNGDQDTWPRFEPM